MCVICEENIKSYPNNFSKQSHHLCQFKPQKAFYHLVQGGFPLSNTLGLVTLFFFFNFHAREGPKSVFWVKFGYNSKIWLKFWNLGIILKFGWNSEIWLKFWNLVEILKFGKISENWSKFWNLVKILKFGMVWYEFVWFVHNCEAECWKRLCNPTPSLTQ